MAENPWILPIQEQLNIGAHHLFEYLKSSTYKFIYDRNKWLKPFLSTIMYYIYLISKWQYGKFFLAKWPWPNMYVVEI